MVRLALMTLLLAGCTSAAVTAPASTQPASTQPASSSAPRQFTSPASHTPTASPRATTAGAALHAITDEGYVSYSRTLSPGQCHVRDSGRLPDPSCTPGSTDPRVTQATIRTTICHPGWTAVVRPPASQTTKAKFDVAYPAYGIPASATSELDHLVPLELGGSNDITNLWPEVGPVPNAKDPVENDLKADVCAGEMTLNAARLAIARNWETAP